MIKGSATAATAKGNKKSKVKDPIIPNGLLFASDDFTLGEIRLELSQTRGQLEVEVSNARGLPASDSGQPPGIYDTLMSILSP